MSESIREDLQELENRLSYSFKRRELLVLSLTHPSYLQENSNLNASNQRMEFLGDSVLGFIVADELYQLYPEQSEGELTQQRSALVKGHVLREIAEELDLESHILIGKAELNAGTRGRASRMEDALEALIAAIYLDGGLKAAREVVVHIFGDFRARLASGLTNHNAKGQLQEYVQRLGGTTADIEYALVQVSGPDHQKEFHISLKVNGVPVGEGRASSRKMAESLAAQQGLEQLKDKADPLS